MFKLLLLSILSCSCGGDWECKGLTTKDEICIINKDNIKLDINRIEYLITEVRQTVEYRFKNNNENGAFLLGTNIEIVFTNYSKTLENHNTDGVTQVLYGTGGIDLVRIIVLNEPECIEQGALVHELLHLFRVALIGLDRAKVEFSEETSHNNVFFGSNGFERLLKMYLVWKNCGEKKDNTFVLNELVYPLVNDTCGPGYIFMDNLDECTYDRGRLCTYAYDPKRGLTVCYLVRLH